MSTQGKFVPPPLTPEQAAMAITYKKALYALAGELLYLFDNMPCPRIEINHCLMPENKVKAQATSYLLVEFNPFFVWYANYHQIAGLMKHELVHIWMHYKNMDVKDSRNHGPMWRKKAIEVGAELYPRHKPGQYKFSFAEREFLRHHGYRVS